MSLTPAQAKADYLAAMERVGGTVKIRRFSGSGPSRTHVDTSVRARVVGGQLKELVGDVVQRSRKMILLAADLVAAGFSLPITTADKIVVGSKELAITPLLDDSTRRFGVDDAGLVAIDLEVYG